MFVSTAPIYTFHQTHALFGGRKRIIGGFHNSIITASIKS